MNRLAGKIALVTGGNSGIGLATAKLFAENGAKVIITGRDRKSLDAAKSVLGEGHLAVQSDVSDLKAIDALYADIRTHFGALDVVFANAGVGGGGPIETITEEVYDRLFDTNVKGLFFTIQKALPLLRPGASVILNASISARIGRQGQSLYGASKSAVRSLARAFSTEFVTRGLRFNAISPGPIETPIWERGGRAPAIVDDLKQQLKSNIPVGRFGTAEEVAQAVLFLASAESSFIVGADLTIDGGVTEMRVVR